MTNPTPPSNSEKPNPEGRPIQRRVVQPLIQWMPLGFSGWELFGSLLNQEWLQALRAFPVTLVTVIWAAYSKGFMDRLSEIFAERGRQNAEDFNELMKKLSEAVRWQVSGFEDKYLECQRLDCQEDDPLGVKSSVTRLLEDVYVPLRLSYDSLSAGLGEGRNQGRRSHSSETMQIWELLKQVRKEPAYRQIAIRAWGGFGKTTLLKHIAYTYGAKAHSQKKAPKLVPFLLYLTRCWKELKNLPKEDASSLPKLLNNYHLPGLPKGQELKVPPHWVRNLLQDGDALVMFDGFDEVPPGERQAVSEWLSEQMRHYRKSVFIVTSRPTAFNNDYTAQRPTASFGIEEFEDEQRQLFVKQWYRCEERLARRGRFTPDVEQRATQNADSFLAQIESRPELKALSGNALLLNMMVRFHRDKQGEELPQRKVDLYQDICELQLGRRPKAKGISLLLNSLSHRQEVLQEVALTMMKRATIDEQEFKQVQREDLLELIHQALVERDPDVEPQEFLNQVVQVSELLVERDGGIYEFSHLSFQEYLAASEIGRLRQESILYDYLKADAWKATIFFYADMNNPVNLIQEAINRNAPTMAYQIWREKSGRMKNLSVTVQQKLEALKQPVLFAFTRQLEEFLQAQQWKEADYETYRLMITAVGKDEGQYFTPEELLNFPCEELRTIDGLWVKHSNGHFGFSVQKKIYVECGAKLDGKYPGDEIWEKFGDRIGWRKNNEWQSHDELTPSLSSPQGIFPWRRAVYFSRGGGGGGGGVFFPTGWQVEGSGSVRFCVLVSSLAQRLVNCSTSQS